MVGVPFNFVWIFLESQYNEVNCCREIALVGMIKAAPGSPVWGKERLLVVCRTRI